MKLIIEIDEDVRIAISRMGLLRISDEMQKEVDKAIQLGTPLNNLRAELYDYITHSPYIKTCTDCCRLRDDVMRIIDKYKLESEKDNGRKDNDI